jgi:hypothetical protein
MMVNCKKCNRRYNDEHRWTICPHDPLESGPGFKYCAEHDLFNCPFHEDLAVLS